MLKPQTEEFLLEKIVEGLGNYSWLSIKQPSPTLTGHLLDPLLLFCQIAMNVPNLM